MCTAIVLVAHCAYRKVHFIGVCVEAGSNGVQARRHFPQGPPHWQQRYRTSVTPWRRRSLRPSSPKGRASAAVIETISHGEQVDIHSLIPASGYTIVEFEADF